METNATTRTVPRLLPLSAVQRNTDLTIPHFVRGFSLESRRWWDGGKRLIPVL